MLLVKIFLLNYVLTVGIMSEKAIFAGGASNIKENIFCTQEAVLPLPIFEQFLPILFFVISVFELTPLWLLARLRKAKLVECLWIENTPYVS